MQPSTKTNHHEELYQQSMSSPDIFWSNQAHQFITWFSPWTHVLTGNFNTQDVAWFQDGKLNACYNCIDRHLPTRSNQVALLWEGNDPNDSQSFTYKTLHEHICKFANVLKQHGVQKGDRVVIYLPMIPEIVISMLACARIGAIHSVVFAGFSADALKVRLQDTDCCLLITADEGVRGDKIIPLKNNCDEALIDCPGIKHMIVVKRTNGAISWQATRDICYQDVMTTASPDCPVEIMDANDPLFILYTSGSTGQPKGILHSTGGYLVYVAKTHYDVFNYQDGDMYWCTADIGWITGHSYLVYGPLANGATTLLFEGIPNYPDYSRYWQIIDKYQVNIFYTSPTAIRALRQQGDDWVTKTSRASLKLLGSVGEPINPEVWQWYYQVVGQKRCPIVNTWWQTETGGIMLTDLPGRIRMPPGSAGVPFFGVDVDIVNDEGEPIIGEGAGHLVIKKPWTGLMLSIYGNKTRFIDTYFKKIPGRYVTGDGAYRDAHGVLWITGRDDDVIKVSGHRLGSQELESALISHSDVAEAAVTSQPHAIKGESIFAFVTLKTGVLATDSLKQQLKTHVRQTIGALATPDDIQWVDALPKTRSGKIMRRILRCIARKEWNHLGDLSTLANADVIDKIIKERI